MNVHVGYNILIRALVWTQNVASALNKNVNRVAIAKFATQTDSALHTDSLE